MKKTLAAVAVLGAFAGTALAADVTLYGKIDGGLNYQHVSKDAQDAKTGHVSSSNSDSFEARSGQNSGSRFGLKGTEQISDGLTVGFQLENGFDSDTGKLGQGDRIFGREARVYVTTDFGEIGFGRMGGIDSGLGSYDLVGDASVFGTGWGDKTGAMSLFFKGKSDRYDNMITYKSPEFAGLTLIAQASLMRDSKADGDEGTHLADRYYAIGLGADYGALTGALTFSMQDYAGLKDRYTKDGWEANPVTDENSNDSDGYTVTAFGAYDFGVTKVSLGAQYFDNVAQKRGSLTPTYEVVEDNPAGKRNKWVYEDIDFGLTGYGVMLGAITPVGSGSLYTSIGYADYEAADLPTGSLDDKADYKVYGVGVGYQYPLSKRTYVYTAASYTHETANAGKATSKDLDTDTTEVMMGLVHNF